jgi:hypothetical protein
MSDWWTQSSTPARGGSAFTPARPGPAHAAQQHTPVQQLAHSQLGHSHSSPGLSSSSSRARFVNDDPDPSAADAPKFLPSFAASPAGKLALVSSAVKR